MLKTFSDFFGYLISCTTSCANLLLVVGLLLSSACTRAIDDEELTQDVEPASAVNAVKILTRANSAISYPLTLYAFGGETGNLETSATVQSADEELSLQLPKGSYHLVAVGGAGQCSLPATPTLNDVIALPGENYLSQPLQMGAADITVKQETVADITLYNQVAAIDLSILNVPTDATDVNVSFSLLYNKLSFKGELSGNVSGSISLTRQTNNRWTASTFYLLPGVSKKLTMSITIITGSESVRTYGYTCDCGLEANTPYTLTGSFENGFKVNGTLTLAGWQEPRDISFTFGEGYSSEEEEGKGDENEGEEEEEEEITDAIPVAGSFWDGHFVGGVENQDETGADILLISADEWVNVPSAFNEESPETALTLAESYTEGELAGWSIPTADEVKLIRSAIGNEKLEETNSTLDANFFTILSAGGEDENGNSVRYLCDNGERSFTWSSFTGSSISKAGSKRTYYLRLIKRIRVTISE